MLRRPLSRRLLLRQFSTSPSIWNIQRPLLADLHPKEESEKLSRTLADESVSNLDAQTAIPLGQPSETISSRPEPSDARESLKRYDLDLVKKRMREWTEQATIALRIRADDFTAKSKITFYQLGSHLNKVTGYEEIEALKRGVVEQEERIHASRQAAREAKTRYEESVVQRSNSQREVNDLLQRKSTWTDSDVGRFTSLVRQDHLYEQEEVRAKAAVDETEDTVEREFSQLTRVILARYHEEQVWSDKIRSASTYGSLAALGLNMLVFIMAILVVEPWKRRRLAQTFENKVHELSAENQARLDISMKDISGLIAGQERLLEELKETTMKSVAVVPMSIGRERVVKDVSEDDRLSPAVKEESVQPYELSGRHLELAAVGAGAFVVGILSSILFGR